MTDEHRATGDQDSGGIHEWVYIGIFIVVWALVHFLVGLFRFPEALAGGQLDSDGYFRLIRVQALVAEWDWFNTEIERSNWPFGEEIHWTRPLDLLIIALALPAKPFLGWDSAIALAGSVVSPICHAALCIGAVWAARPLIGGARSPLAMLLMLSMAGAFLYSVIGRADHHALLLLITLAALGGWMRALGDSGKDRHAVGVALVMALGIWVSPEALIPLAAIYLAGGVVWILHGNQVVRPNRLMSAVLLLGLAAALFVERPPSDWLAVEFDRISLPHLTMAALALSFWGVAGKMSRIGTSGRYSRVAAALVGGALTVAILLLIHPGFHQGPIAQADPVMGVIFFPYVQEMQSLFPRDWEKLVRVILYMGAPVMALVFALVYIIRRKLERTTLAAWLVLTSMLIVTIPLGVAQVRLVGYSGVAAALGLTGFLVVVLPLVNKRMTGWARRFARIGLMSAVIIGAPIFALLVGAVTLDPDEGEVESGQLSPEGCSVRALAPVLVEAAAGEGEKALVTSINRGPEILYRTGIPILSGPYHRNHEGMVALTDFLLAPEPETSRGIAMERQVGWVLLCPSADTWYSTRAPETSVIHLLVEDSPPPWLRRISVDRPGAEGFLLYSVVAETGGG